MKEKTAGVGFFAVAFEILMWTNEGGRREEGGEGEEGVVGGAKERKTNQR